MSEERHDDIGTLLKGRRQELGFSLQDAAQHTRIRKSYLESLEANQFSDLPGQAYVTGFIRVYSRYLDLDSGPLLELLEQPSSEGLEVSGGIAPALKTHVSATKKKKSRGNGGLFAFGFVFVLIVGATLYFLLPDEKPPTAPIVEKSPLPQEVEELKTQGQKDVEPVAEERLPVTETVEKEEQPLPEPVAEEPPPAEPVVEEPGPQSQLPAIKAGGSSLRMLAMSQGSLIIKIDNRKPHEYVLHAGLDLTWKVGGKVSFELGGAQQARFWLDGKEIVLGDQQTVQLLQAP